MKVLPSYKILINSGKPVIRLLKVTAICILVFTSACTTTSQTPLSVRQQQERHLENDTTDASGENADTMTVNSQGNNPAPPGGLETYRGNRMEENEADFEKRTNEALNVYMKAQSAYNNSDYNEALRYINEAKELIETADFHALKGAIYHRLGQPDERDEHWGRAVELNPGVVSNMYPGMQQWYEAN